MSARQKLPATICILLMMLTGCLVRKRVVTNPGPRPNRPPLTATKDDLIRRIQDHSNPIESFLMKVEMAPSVGAQYAGVITDYATIGAYILYQRPDDMRIIGQDPIMNHTVFDMVSSGREFRIYIPRKNLFVIGDNEAPARSKNELENLRPKAFLTALIIDPPDPETDIALVEDDTNETKSVYILVIVRRDHDQYWLARNVYFDRYTLQIIRQKTFDSSGAIVSESTYSNWKKYDGVSFPSDLVIKRPQEHYQVQLRVGSIKMNPGNVTPDRFVLGQPPGSRLEELK